MAVSIASTLRMIDPAPRSLIPVHPIVDVCRFDADPSGARSCIQVVAVEVMALVGQWILAAWDVELVRMPIEEAHHAVSIVSLGDLVEVAPESVFERVRGRSFHMDTEHDTGHVS